MNSHLTSIVYIHSSYWRYSKSLLLLPGEVKDPAAWAYLGGALAELDTDDLLARFRRRVRSG